ncbi:MAG: type II toxin-antitoxin system HicA family toxin [Armatimonadetes bacterium]|nr:type II toxin-antitoxin system HicA family toxin [Anaerolineae bacterium]
MTKQQKRIEKLRNNPQNVSFEALRQVLEAAGFELDHATGSHHIFRQKIDELVLRVNIPFARPVKSRYVKQALQAIDQAQQAQLTIAHDTLGDDDDTTS